MIDPLTKAALAHNERIGGSRFVSYGGLELLVPVRDIREAMVALGEGEHRRRMMASVNATLAKNFPKVVRQTASQKLAMLTAQDVAIWFANEVLEGRATIELQ